MTAVCDCGATPFGRHVPDCAYIVARQKGPEPEPDALVSWRWSNASETQADVIWRDGEGIERRAQFIVDSDIDGLTFHHKSGEELADDDEAEELLLELESDMASLRGSEFIPIRAHYHRVHVAHQEPK